MLARKDKVVAQNNDGIVVPVQEEQDHVLPRPSAASPAAAPPAGGRSRSTAPSAATLAAKHVIVATGSKPRALPGAPFDNELILDNDGALAIPEVPKRSASSAPA